MSHFSVLVVANSYGELEDKLQPFHEYECTGIKDEYVEFVEADLTVCESEYLEYKGDYESFEEFMKEYHGYEELKYRTNYNDDDGNRIGIATSKWGRWTNPNAKWDWWIVGGRYENKLIHKDSSKCNSLSIAELSVPSMIKVKTDYYVDQYRDYKTLKSLPEHKQSAFSIDTGLVWLSKTEAQEMNDLSESEYVELHSRDAFTYAMVDFEGNWLAKGEMGWFGVDGNYDDSYNEAFWKELNSLPDHQIIWVVDCHI